MKSILENYRNGTAHQIHMLDNGLIYAGEEGVAVTWMDAIVNGRPVTPRTGVAVEINALWYNAIRFALETAELNGDENFIKEWKSSKCIQSVLGYAPSQISRCCRNERKTSHGFIWKFKLHEKCL
jgi:predicted glycogen debranching enzyme